MALDWWEMAQLLPGATDVQAEVSGREVGQSRPGASVSEASPPWLHSRTVGGLEEDCALLCATVSPWPVLPG